MKKIQNLLAFSLLLLSLNALISCSSDNNDYVVDNGLTQQSWTTGTKIRISAEDVYTLAFNASANWEIQNNAMSMLSIDKTSGSAGNNTVTVKVLSSSSTQGSLTLKVNGYPSVTEINFVLINNYSEDYDVNVKTDAILKKYYLWNDEYKTLSPNFNQPYDEFLENTLLSMKGNTLDKKLQSNGEYSLFSYIEKLDASLQSRTTLVQKKLQYSFGFVNFLRLQYADNVTINFAIQGVADGSSSFNQGLKRGTIIAEVNGNSITTSNWKELYLQLMQPSGPSTVVVKDKDNKAYTINSSSTYVNPILKYDAEDGIGYLAYSSFDAGFDEELYDVFKYFKRNAINDLILDLRYNGGGHVISANLIASCIAGSAYADNDFIRYRYNTERMKEFDGKMPSTKFAINKYENLNSSLTAGALNLSKVYCLVSNNTASASELVINSLRGIGINVVLIGETTRGKNVGMESQSFSCNDNTYQIYPITFQSYNAKDYGAYENGFSPEYEINENHPNSNYFEGYGDFGTTDDALYAKALELITGISTTRSTTRSADITPGVKVLATPNVGIMDMIK